VATISATAASQVRFNWIIDKKNDLIWYIGSALAGWFYIMIVIALAGYVPNDPLEGVITTLTLGGIHIDITLELLVVISWAWLIDAPHVFATLARTFFDPDEREMRGKYLRRSWLWFGFGPLFIGVPYLIGAALEPYGVRFGEFWLNSGWLVYFVFFRLWAYYHVVRQHWGFFSLYKRRNDDMGDVRENQIDEWFFNLSFYLPLIMFMTSAFYADTPGFPDLGLRAPLIGGMSIGAVIYPLAWLIYIGAVSYYVGWQVGRWQAGKPINGSKLLFLASVLPLHLAAFAHPLLVVFLIPIITVGHNLQYHRIVWTYGQNKYGKEERKGFTVAKAIFASLPAYIIAGLLFTFALYKGPWVEWLHAATGLQMDTVLLNGISMMAGVADPAELGLGEKIFAALLTGWAMQHYYLDGKIWRVNKDKTVSKNLNV
jgi:hypothetical protein